MEWVSRSEPWQRGDDTFDVFDNAQERGRFTKQDLDKSLEGNMWSSTWIRLLKVDGTLALERDRETHQGLDEVGNTIW
mgnify:CR=1 FL=1